MAFVLAPVESDAQAAPIAEVTEGSPTTSAPRWVMRHFTTAEGLPVGSALAARLDRDGFLWLATHEGLVRFDGSRFVVHDLALHPQMGSNRMLELARAPDGSLYARTDEGALLALDGARIQRVAPDPEKPMAMVHELHEQPLCVTLDSGLFCAGPDRVFRPRARMPETAHIRMAAPLPDSAATWLLSPRQGVWLHDGEVAHPVVASNRFESMLSNSMAGDIVALDGHTLAILVASGVELIDSAGQVREVAPPEQFADDPGIVINIRHGPDASLIVATDQHLYQYFVADDRWRRLSGTAAPGIGQVWFEQNGLLWYRQGRRLYRDGHEVLRTNGMILDVFVDPLGIAWIATRRDGLYALSPLRTEWFDSADGLAFDNVYGLDLDRDGRLWLGSLGGGIQRVDASKRPPAVEVFDQRDGLPGANPWTVLAAPDGSVYSAPYAGGLLRYDPGRGRFAPVVMPETLAGAQLRALALDEAGALWVAGNRGVWSFDGGPLSDDRWRLRWQPGASVATIQSMLHLPDAVWFGTSNGLWRMHDDVVEPIVEELLGEIQVRGLLHDRDGDVWAATQGLGLVRVRQSAAGFELQRFARADGLPSNSVHTVIEDDHGGLWVNSNQGVFRLDRNDVEDYLDHRVPKLAPLLVTHADGLPGLEGNGGVQPSAARDAAGRIWFPTQAGVVGIDPERFRQTRPPTVPVIDGLELQSETLGPDSIDTLPLGQRSPTIHFAAADLSGGVESRFRYRLLPADRQWRDATGSRSVALSQLAPGRYRFQLLAANSEGNWSAHPAELAFSVPPFWYETRVLRLGLVIAGLLALALLVHWRMRSLRSRAAVLNQMVDQRTLELENEKRRIEQALDELETAHRALAGTHRKIESSNRRLAEQTERLTRLDGFRKRLLADVSHELRTPLMLIEMPLARLAEQPEAALRGEIEIATHQAGRLRKLIDQLVTLVQAESGQLELSISRIDLAGLLAQLSKSWAVIAELDDIGIELKAFNPAVEIYADRDLLESAIGNLIDNAIKYSPQGGTIRVEVRTDAGFDCVRVEICDSGHGFDAATSQTLFDRFCRGDDPPRAGREGLGIGLALAREITELHGGRIGARSNAGAGSCFWIELPLGNQHVALEELNLTDGAAVAPARGIAPGDESTAGDERIVLVEDHPELARYLGERLADYLPVTVLTSAEAALEALADCRSDCRCGMLICDVMLPGLTGLELTRRLRAEARWHSLPILMISARATEVDRSAVRASGADDYLTKPFGFGELLDRIGAHWPAAAARIESARAVPVEDPLLAIAHGRLTDPEFGVADWAAAAHLSARQLRRRVTELTGQAPRVWLREQRLLRTRALVGSGECRTLAEAGARAGLDNPSYLYRLYRARFGDE